MSVAAVTWALSQWLDPAPKMVLVAIADRVNHKGGDDSGFPSLDDIAETACQSRRSVQRHIATLADIGLLVKEYRAAEGGRQTSNLYRINMAVTVRRDGADAGGEGDNLTPSGGCQSDTLGGDTGDTLGGATGDTPMNGKNNGKRNISPQAPQGAKETRADEEDADGFGRFFEIWTGSDPAMRFDNRGRAFAVWKQLTPAERQAAALPATIMAVIAGQRRARRTSLMNAATYLRDRAFERVDAAAAPAGAGALVPLALFGRPWWCRFFEFAKGGDRTATAGKAKFMAQLADRGQGVGVPLAEAQALEASAANYVYVLVASPEFIAWRDWFALRGFQLPRPAKADRIWLPSVLPPAADVGEAAQ